MRAAASTLRIGARAVAVCAVAAAMLAGPTQASAGGGCSGANANPNGVSLAAARSATLCILNQQRRAHGLRPLRENGDLSLASQRHANSMSDHKYFAHGDFVGRIRAAHYLHGAGGWTLGENIAWGSWEYATPASIVDSWMHSPPHRSVILNGGFHDLGIGISYGFPGRGSHGATFTVDFGSRN